MYRMFSILAQETCMGLPKQKELTANHIKTETAASKILLVSGICNSSTMIVRHCLETSDIKNSPNSSLLPSFSNPVNQLYFLQVSVKMAIIRLKV